MLCGVTEEERPLNLSLKGNKKNHSIWSPASLCEQQTKSLLESMSDSNLRTSVLNPKENNWRGYTPNKKEISEKLPTVLSTGEKTFTVSFS